MSYNYARIVINGTFSVPGTAWAFVFMQNEGGLKQVFIFIRTSI